MTTVADEPHLTPGLATVKKFYRVRAINAYTGRCIQCSTTLTIDELSHSVPISSDTGIDTALLHADITKPDEWEVITEVYDAETGLWSEIPDPRIFMEDLKRVDTL